MKKYSKIFVNPSQKNCSMCNITLTCAHKKFTVDKRGPLHVVYQLLCFPFAPSLSLTSDRSRMLSGVVLNVQGLKMATGEPDVPPLQGRARFRELLLGDQPCQSEDRYGILIVR